MKITILLLCILELGNLVLTTAYPGFAGHCDGGDLSGQSLSPHGSLGGGDLGNGFFTITIGGEQPVFDTPLELNINQDYTVRIERNNGFMFKGLLARLPLPGVFSFPDDTYTDNFQLHPLCNPEVSAVTHKNRDEKSVVEFTLNHNEVGEHIIEITSLVSYANNWFYSLFSLQFVDSDPSTPVPTPNPTPPPTSSPTPVPTPLTTPVPTTAPNPSTCSDSTEFFSAVKPGDMGWTKMKSCDGWVIRKSTAWRCKNVSGVKENCPDTCTNCCVDTEDTFNLLGNGKSKTCFWAADNPDIRCKKPPTRQLCAVTCGECD